MTLPNFLVIGAPKAGTHSLYDYLRGHPEIYMPKIKGTRFFCYPGRENLRTHHSYPVKTLAEFEAVFDGARGEKAVGEASALYLERSISAGRIHATIPHVKMIASLREPVQRAFSIYHMNLRNAGANAGKDFLTALKDDPAIRMPYYEGLKPFYDRFDREQLKIIRFDDLARDTLGTVQDLFAFLGVRTDFVPELKVSNPGGIPRSQALHGFLKNRRLKNLARSVFPERVVETGKAVRSANLKKHVMTDDERERAYSWFEEDILRTQDLVQIDLSAWLRR